MKKTKLVALLTAVLCSATPVMSVSAATLSEVIPNGSTEVKANIIDPGSVNYIITIPDTADFGTLTQPEDDKNPHYVFNNFEVVATELNIQNNQCVSIFMKDADADDNQFYISQQGVDNPFKLQYDVYGSMVDESNIAGQTALNNPINSPGSSGYHLCTFTYGTAGSIQYVTLALDQNALCNQNLSEIAGDYSGFITFHSAVIRMS